MGVFSRLAKLNLPKSTMVNPCALCSTAIPDQRWLESFMPNRLPACYAYTVDESRSPQYSCAHQRIMVQDHCASVPALGLQQWAAFSAPDHAYPVLPGCQSRGCRHNLSLPSLPTALKVGKDKPDPPFEAAFQNEAHYAEAVALGQCPSFAFVFFRDR